MYADYYMRQQKGGEMPAFVGARYQRGHVIGSVLAGLFRRILPYVKANAKNVGVNLLRTGKHIADDVLDGQKFIDSSKRRIPEGISNVARHFNWQTDDGLSSVHIDRRLTNRKRRAIAATTSVKSKKQKKNKNKKTTKTRRRRRKKTTTIGRSIFD